MENIPIYIINLPWRTDRKEHMISLLDGIGFKNYNFPHLLLAKDVNIEDMLRKNRITKEVHDKVKEFEKSGNKSLGDANKLLNKPYVANAYDHTKNIKKIAKSKFDYGMIMEDDLMTGMDKKDIIPHISKQIEILNKLDPEWDMFYLEACYERCGNTIPISQCIHKSYAPQCSASIIFSKKGAIRVIELCRPLFDGIDLMYPQLISEGKLRAYMMSPIIFEQDEFWGSDAGRDDSLTLKKVHRSRNKLCCDDFGSIVNIANMSIVPISVVMVAIAIVLVIIGYYLFNSSRMVL